MKKIIKLSLVLAVVMTTMSTYAIGGDFSLQIRKGKGNEVSFALNGINKANVSIYDEENNLIFTELATGKDGISKIYNLDEFPVGTYYLVVETNIKKVKHEIIIGNHEVSTLTTKEISEVYKPTLKNQNVVVAN